MVCLRHSKDRVAGQKLWPAIRIQNANKSNNFASDIKPIPVFSKDCFMGFIRRELCHEKRPPEGRRNSNQKFIGSEYSLPYGFVFAKRLQFQLSLNVTNCCLVQGPKPLVSMLSLRALHAHLVIKKGNKQLNLS